jgi:hypothetical protein
MALIHDGRSLSSVASFQSLFATTLVDLYYAAFPDIQSAPQAPVNIVSITQRLESGWCLGGTDTQGMVLKKWAEDVL